MKENFKQTVTTITVSSPLKKSSKISDNTISRTTSEREFKITYSNKYDFRVSNFVERF